MRILVVDDEPLLLSTLALILEAKGYAVATCNQVPAAIELIRHEPFAALLADVWMPGDGANVVLEMRRRQPQAQILVITGHLGPEAIPSPILASATAVLYKPLDVADLLARLAALPASG